MNNATKIKTLGTGSKVVAIYSTDNGFVVRVEHQSGRKVNGTVVAEFPERVALENYIRDMGTVSFIITDLTA